MNSGNLCYLLAHSRSLSHLLANFYVLPSFGKVQARQILAASRCLWQCMPPLYLPCSQLGKPSVFFMKWYIYLSISVSLSLSLSTDLTTTLFICPFIYLSCIITIWKTRIGKSGWKTGLRANVWPLGNIFLYSYMSIPPSLHPHMYVYPHTYSDAVFAVKHRAKFNHLDLRWICC